MQSKYSTQKDILQYETQNLQQIYKKETTFVYGFSQKKCYYKNISHQGYFKVAQTLNLKGNDLKCVKKSE